MLRQLLFILVIIVLQSAAAAAPRGVVSVDAKIDIYPDEVVCPLQETLFGINVHPHAKYNMAKPDVVETVKSLGLRSLRFPNGCVADLYNWKDPGDKWASVDEFLGFCDDLNAEPYYTINMQGGTEGLTGPVPEGASLEEVIKYQHLKPNPCGYTNYHFGTLAETLEFVRKYTIDRALSGKTPVLHYELGNENWGQSTTDWPPDVYAKTCEVYSRAMRDLLKKAKSEHSELAGLDLYIVAVGYPVMGNNMQFVDTPERSINIKWTSLLNQLYKDKLIDAVQEHFYPYASADGGALAWAAHNLQNIIFARKGLANDRLNGYQDPEIAYKMPMEHTEWNMKCWGPQFTEAQLLKNTGFDDGISAWNVSGGKVDAVSWAARRGNKGLRISNASGDICEVKQAFDKPEKTRIVVAGVWARTDKPESVIIQLKQIDGEEPGKVLGEWGGRVPDMWERIVASAVVPSVVNKLELVMKVEGEATVYLDEAKLYYTTEERGHCPISATTYEQDLFLVDTFREMALGGCPRAHVHHLFGDYPCGTMTMAGQVKDSGKVFQFFKGNYGDSVVRMDCKVDDFSHFSAANPWATHFNALAPDLKDISMLAGFASRRGDMIYITLINRTSDRNIKAKLNLNANPSDKTASVRVLTGQDVDIAGSELSEEKIEVNSSFERVVTPYSAQIISIKL